MPETLWGTESHLEELEKPNTPKRAFRFFVGLVITLVLLAGGTAAYYFFLKPDRPNVGVEISHVNDVFLGEPFAVTVSYSNYSDSVLKDATLSLTLPDGVFFLGHTNGERVSEMVVGDVGPGSLSKSSEFQLIALTNPQSLKRLQAKLKYKIGGGSNAEFESPTNVDISVGQPAIALNLTAPQSVVNGEDIEVVLSYQNNSKINFRNVKLTIDYPPFFQVEGTSLGDDKFNDWIIPSLPPNATGTIILSANVLGVEQSQFSLNARLSTELMGQAYDVNTQVAQMSITPSPFALSIGVNGSSEYIAHIGDRLEYVIRYKNTANVALQNVSVRTTFAGELFIPSGLSTTGVFNSLTNTISWNSLNTPELASLAPGDERTLTFSIPLVNQFPIRRLSDKNYSLKVQAQIESPTVPSGFSASKTISLAKAETKVQGMVNLRAAGYFYDAPSGILNSGPYPPRVNQPTRYTIHWLVTNYATDVSDVHVSALLAPGVKFTGVIKSNVDAKPAYNAGTGEVTWDVPLVLATKGIVGSPLEAIFQVEVTPSVNQVGQNISLIGETKFVGKDVFTGGTLEATSRGIDSGLPDDTKLPSGQSHGVQP